MLALILAYFLSASNRHGERRRLLLLLSGAFLIWLSSTSQLEPVERP
jgi:hypothetical protein